MIILKLATNGLDLIRLETSLVTSDNKKSVSLEVDFDDSWTGYGKSATFKSSSSDKIYEVPLADDACVVPWEVLESVGTMSVGVRGVKDDGSVVASDLVDYKIAQGAKAGDGTSKDPTPTVYQQLLSNYGSVDQKITKEIQERKDAIANEKSERVSAINSEVSNRATADNALTKRIDNLILSSGTESSAELIDARTGYDGILYDTLGTAIRTQVNNLNDDIGDLEIGTKNIFNSKELLKATGWTRNGNSYTGTAGNLGKAYKENNYPISFEPNTKYTLSLKALTDGSASTDGIGIQFEFYYTDGTKGVLELLNNTLTETSYVFGTDSQKSISYMRIRHSSGGNNTWVLSEIQIEKGNKTNYVNHFTANDIIAKEKIEILELKQNEVKADIDADIDNLAVQSSNLIIAVGIDNVKNKEFYVSTDDGYNAFPFVGAVKDKLVCVYSVGKSHVDDTIGDIFAKTSTNGVIWSKAKKIISTENIRDTITGLGHDSLGNIYFWNRKGTPVNANCSFDLYETSDGIVFTKKSSPVFDIKPSHIGDALHIPTVGVISFYNTYRANRNSYGYVLTKDGGETWNQIEIASPETQSDTPTEIYGVYIGDGKIIALGRSEDSASMFQIQSNDYGKTWETKKTNITDVYLSTPTLIYSDDGYITVYYYNRADGKLKKRRALASTVFESSTSWGESYNIASGAIGQDAGNANSVKFNGYNIIVYYSGTDTETNIINIIN